MNRYTPNAPESSLRWWRRKPVLIAAGLALASCCFWSGLAAWLFAPFTYFMANRLSYVQGKAELIAPAQWHPGGILSPDGRYIVMGWSKNGPHEEFVWDLATGVQYPFNLGGGALCWLNPDQFLVFDTGTNTYYLVQAQGAKPVRAALISVQEQYNDPDKLIALRERWQAAQKLYVLDTFGAGAYTVLTLEHGQPYIYRSFGSGRKNIETVEAFTQDLPHVRIPTYCNSPPEPAYSPNGQFYTRLSTGTNAHVLIYSREGKLVAEAYKNGWSPRLKGWSYDSSGVYFDMLISGSAAAGFMPDAPIFKLSPLTPEEQRWLIAQRIGLGAAIVAALVGVGWWWRRRRSRESR